MTEKNSLTTYSCVVIKIKKKSIKMAPHIFESKAGKEPLFFLACVEWQDTTYKMKLYYCHQLLFDHGAEADSKCGSQRNRYTMTTLSLRRK